MASTGTCRDMLTFLSCQHIHTGGLVDVPERQHAWATVARPRDLGDFLRSQRVAQEWTQEELAAELGITRQYLHEIEQGKPSLYTERLFAILRELGITLRVEATR